MYSDWRSLPWGCWRQTNQKQGTYMIGWEITFGSLWLVLSQKVGQNLGKLKTINQVLTVWELTHN